MRILTLFRSRLLESRGTPSRSRNLTKALADQADSEVHVLSGDPAGSVEQALGLSHRPVTERELPEQLAAAAAGFRPDIVYGQGTKSVPLLAGLGSGGPLKVVDLHGDLAAEKLEQYWRPLSHRLRAFARHRLEERRWLGKMDAMTVASASLAEQVRRLGKPTEVLWGGVDPELFRIAAPTSGEDITVGYAGNFRPYQGLPSLVDAMSGLDSRFRLLLVGDSAGAEPMLERARRVMGDRLTVLDPVPYDEIPALLAAADVLVVPRPVSRSARFGFPSKLPEYLALGRPVVVTDVGEQGRVVRHREHGLVVPPGSADALAAALTELVDEKLRRRLGEAGRQLAVNRLSWERIGRQARAFLGRLIEQREAHPETAGRQAVSGG